MTDDSINSGTDDSGGKSLRNVAIVVLLLIAFGPLRLLALPIAAVAILVGIAYLFRSALRFNRSVGLALITTVTASLFVYFALVYRAELRHRALLENLDTYADVTVRRNVFPLPYVHQLSVGRGVADRDFASILRLDGLAQITDLYLDNDILTDACLQDAAKITNLGYIFIDCDNISDDAILQFETRFPDCRVIPYKRNLHGPQTVFLGMPPEDG
ncbi:hypothetical protein [Stieleria varia]|uniref:Uncharacterized protein n=1 Tax=Stieleria varia TaxID=2528005 RepID=A0A5C6A1J9_9BACT|nr:hypothetical protein [Stieleria varia]TWT93255.1 hypothetical protein Pla52n_59130 [Stieleria varia]